MSVHGFDVYLKTFHARECVAAYLANQIPNFQVDRLVVLEQSPLGGEQRSTRLTDMVLDPDLVMLSSHVPLQVAQLSRFVGTLPARVLDSQMSMLLVKDQSLGCCKSVVINSIIGPC